MGINKIIVGIILLGALNVIFIIYSLRNTYRLAKKERQKIKSQKSKIDKFYPKKS